MMMKRRTFIGGAGAVLAAPAFAGSRVHQVKITGFAFEPAELKVQPADKIEFINLDLSPHTATAMDDSWDTGILEQGESTTLTVADNWDQQYYCALHPHMRGTLMLST